MKRSVLARWVSLSMALVVLAASVASGSTPEQTTDAVILDWMVPSTELTYHVSGHGEFEFSLIVASVSSTALDTRWSFDAGALVAAAAFDLSTRQLNGFPNVTSFLWVNPEDVEAGAGRIAHEDAPYIGLTIDGHVFETPRARYVYHAVSGYLVAATALPEGTSIRFMTRNTGVEIPSPNVGPEPMEHSWDRFQLAATGADADSSRTDVSCTHQIRHPLGNSMQPIVPCIDHFKVNGEGGLDSYDIQFQHLQTGRVDALVIDVTGVYASGWCKADVPVATLKDCRDPELSRALSVGAARLESYANFSACLNPTVGFGCYPTTDLLFWGDVTNND